MRQEPFFGKTHFFTFFNEPCEEQSLCNPLCPRPWPLGGRFYLIKERLSSGSSFFVSTGNQVVTIELFPRSPIWVHILLSGDYTILNFQDAWVFSFSYLCFFFLVFLSCFFFLIHFICCWGYTKFWGSHNSFAWL